MALHASHAASETLCLFGGVVGREVGQLVPFQVSPDTFVGVVVEAVGRKKFDSQSRIVISNFTDKGAFVLVGAVPEKHDVAGHVTQQRSKEFCDVLRFEGVLEFDVEKELAGGSDGAHKADFFPAPKVVRQLRRLTAWGPGLGNKRGQAGSGFVEEPDGAFSFERVFFTARQVA